VLSAELPQRGGGLGDLAGGEGGNGQRAAGDPVVAVSGDQFAQVERDGGEDVPGKPEDQRGDSSADESPGAVADRQGDA